MFLLLALSITTIGNFAVGDNANDGVKDCEQADTLACLLPLTGVRKIFPKLNICMLQDLGLPKNSDKMEKVCKLFGDYNHCVDKVAKDERCKVTSALDGLSEVSGSLMCDIELHQMIIKNKPCYDKITSTKEYKKCGSKLNKVVNWKKLGNLFKKSASNKHCELLEALSDYEACKRKLADELCADSMKELLDHVKAKVDGFVEKFQCTDSVVPIPEPSSDHTDTESTAHDSHMHRDHDHDHHGHHHSHSSPETESAHDPPSSGSKSDTKSQESEETFKPDKASDTTTTIKPIPKTTPAKKQGAIKAAQKEKPKSSSNHLAAGIITMALAMLLSL